MTRRKPRAAPAVVVALALLTGLLAGCDPPQARQAGHTSTSTATTHSGAEAIRGFHSTRNYQPTATPVRLQIPTIAVDTQLQQLGKDPGGSIQTPTGPHKWDQAGWYAGGTRPGDPGSAVLLGHVDSKTGPAVFYRVRELRPGDQLTVTTTDGTRLRFTVDRVEQFPKSRFPTADVYYPTGTPMLRLVTCGGSFDGHHYRSNVIAFATLRR